MGRNRITQEQENYIKTHLDEYPRSEMAKKLGITTHCLYKYINIYGGKVKKYDKYDVLREKIKKMYPTMTAKEIAVELNMSTSSIQYQATKLGLTHNKETQERLDKQRNTLLRKSWNAEKYAKAGKRMHLLYKREELLVLSGLAQHTRLHIRQLYPKALNAKMYLRKNYNYFYSKGEPFVLCYDKETRRHPKEQYYSEKFGFEFVEATSEELA